MHKATIPANRLRQWRAEMDFSLAETSGLTGYSVPMLSRIERGERCPSAKAKVVIARRLGVPVSDLFPVEQISEDDLAETAP